MLKNVLTNTKGTKTISYSENKRMKTMFSNQNIKYENALDTTPIAFFENTNKSMSEDK